MSVELGKAKVSILARHSQAKLPIKRAKYCAQADQNKVRLGINCGHYLVFDWLADSEYECGNSELYWDLETM